MKLDKTNSLAAYLLAALFPEVIENLIEDSEITEDGRIKIKFIGGKNIRRSIPKGTKIEELCSNLIATRMLALGYIWFPVENGYIVVSPSKEEYQIIDLQCTCPHYITKGEKCKHLILSDWSIKYRALQSKLKTSILQL